MLLRLVAGNNQTDDLLWYDVLPHLAIEPQAERLRLARKLQLASKQHILRCAVSVHQTDNSLHVSCDERLLLRRGQEKAWNNVN